MQVTRCDRCGNIFDRPRSEAEYRIANHIKLTYVIGNGQSSYIKAEYDICPDCSKDLIHWLEEKKED